MATDSFSIINTDHFNENKLHDRREKCQEWLVARQDDVVLCIGCFNDCPLLSSPELSYQFVSWVWQRFRDQQYDYHLCRCTSVDKSTGMNIIICIDCLRSEFSCLSSQSLVWGHNSLVWGQSLFLWGHILYNYVQKEAVNICLINLILIFCFADVLTYTTHILSAFQSTRQWLRYFRSPTLR